MKILATLIAALLLMQSTVHAEEPWRFITLADWHLAQLYVQPRNAELLYLSRGQPLVRIMQSSQYRHYNYLSISP